jgi:PPOX class probable F420-dependent enzyme
LPASEVHQEEQLLSTEMTRAEIGAFLDSQRTLVLVTLRPDGSPVAHPMWFTRLGDALYVDTQRSSLKRRNVARDARVCAVAEAGESYFELRGVRVEGRCEEVKDPGEIARARAAQTEKNARIGSGLGELPAWFADSREQRRERGERVLLRIPFQRVYSWDFSKARGHYAR